MHPHWQSEEEVPVRITARQPQTTEPEARVKISRKPAAIVGITIVVLLGVFFFYGTEELMGQLSMESDGEFFEPAAEESFEEESIESEEYPIEEIEYTEETPESELSDEEMVMMMQQMAMAEMQGDMSEDTSTELAIAPENVPMGTASVPTNPYTVDNDRIHPFDSTGNPIPAAFGDAPPLHAGAPKPFKQPNTGPEVWVVLALSLIGIEQIAKRARLASC